MNDRSELNAAQAIRAAAERLAGSSDTARLDAEVLMAHLLGTSRSDLLLHRMADPCPPGYGALIERRLGQEPAAYIIGRQEFFGLPFIVSPAVLIPRGDSEVLVEAALAAAPNARRLLDLLRTDLADYTFIEIMACPGGCIGGGGQPITKRNVKRVERIDAIYVEDEALPIRKSHENPEVNKLYEDFLHEPLGHKSHELLHTHYHDKHKKFL